MNGRTSSAYAGNSGNMFAGEEDLNGFHADRDQPCRISVGASSIRACGGSDLDREGPPEDLGFGREDRDALVERIEELEKELYDYQYHLGLLLMEKKLQTSEFEELRERLSEATENLKLERAAFLSTLSEKQKQEQSVLMELKAERQHVADLEETIHKILSEEKQLRGTLPSWEQSQQGHELELKGSQTLLGERKMNKTNEKEAFCEIQEEVDESQNSFVRMNNASNYRETGISDRQQNLVSEKKEAENKQGKLEKEKRDLLAAGVKLHTRESALHSEKQVFEELASGRDLSDGKLKDKLNKFEKQNVEVREYGGHMIIDLLTGKKEVETDKLRIQKDKETLNTLYNRLQKFKQELIKKRDLLLSPPEHCKACMDCKITFSERDFASFENFEGSELSGDILLLSIPNEHLEKKHMKGQNDDSSFQSKGHESVKTGGCMPNKRAASLKVVSDDSEETLNDMPEEVKQLKKCGSEDLKDANEESKLNLLNADGMGGRAEQWEFLSHASDRTSKIDPCDRKTEPANERHRKRQRTSEIILSFPGQKRYNFRRSTILNALVSELQSEHIVLGSDSDGTDMDYEPSNSDNDSLLSRLKARGIDKTIEDY